jgi:vitamin B12 transporter
MLSGRKAMVRFADFLRKWLFMPVPGVVLLFRNHVSTTGMYRRILFIFSVNFLSTNVEGQIAVADSIVLKSAVIIDNRHPESNPGLNQLILNPELTNQTAYSLGELMSRSSAAFVKQYSPGTLASPSLRGTGAAHTALIWNGLNLQSSMNGQIDLSLIPSILFDEFRIQEGAGASSWGSGAIGGSVFLQSNPSNLNVIKIQTNVGSWGFQQEAVDVNLGKNKFRSRSRAYFNSNENNFKFVNEAVIGNPIQRQLNSKQQNLGLMQDLTYNISSSSIVKGSVWYQKAKRHIPPILTVPVSVAKQNDASLRASVGFQKQFQRLYLKVTAGYLSEQIHFKDSLFQLNTDNRAKTYIGEAVLGRSFKNGLHRIEFGTNYTLNNAITASYGTLWKSQERIAGFASLKSAWFSDRLNTLLQLRQEFVNGIAVIPTPSLSGDIKLHRKFHLKSQVARTYRIPTLNDLYWVPGGNPNLQSEQGFSYESGLHFRASPTKWKIESSIGSFASRIKNWIIWTPGNSYWTPQNVHLVYSRGCEFRLQTNYKKSDKLSFSVNAHWQYVKSTSETNTKNPEFIGKQLIYIPELTGNNSISITYRGYRLETNQIIVGHRYITSDNSDYLPAYQVFNASISKLFQFKKISATGYFQLNNLSNTSYQNVVWRPMPLRSWMTGITFQIKP